MYNYLMNNFQALFCHIIKWIHQLSIIQAYAPQFTRAASSQAIRSVWQVYTYSMIAIYIWVHQFGFHF